MSEMDAMRSGTPEVKARAEAPVDVEMEALVRSALARVEAPAGFADRVMERAGIQVGTRAGMQAGRRDGRRGGARVVVMPRRLHLWAAGSIAAALLMGAVMGGDAYRRHEHAVADREFAISQRITEQTLEQTRQQLAEQGIRLDD